MPKVAKRFLVFAAILLALATLGLLFVNLYVQSAASTAKIERKLSAALRLPVKITNAAFTPWNGLKITGLTVPGAIGSGSGNFLQAAAIVARVNFSSLFSRHIVIREIILEEPRVSWAQTEKGKWRLPAAQESTRDEKGEKHRPPPNSPETTAEGRREDTPRKAESLTVSVERFQIRRGRFEFLDAAQNPVASFDQVEVNAPRVDAQLVEGTFTSASVGLGATMTLHRVQAPFRYAVNPANGARVLKLTNLTSEVANGLLTGNLTIEPERPDAPFAVDASFEGVDLNQLVSGLGGMPGQAAGQLGGTLQLSGRATRRESITGAGRLVLASGRFRQYEVLQFLGQFLQIQELSQLTLQRADADFRVAGEKIHVDQLTLQSPNLKLTAKGRIKFNQKLDLDARLTVNQSIARQLPGAIEANFTPEKDSENRYIDFDITGTLEKPKTNLRERILGKSYEAQAVNLFKSLFGGTGEKKKDDKKKHKSELLAAPSPSPMIPEVNLPPPPGEP